MKDPCCVHYQQHVFQGFRDGLQQKVAGSSVHVLVHEVQNGEPEGSKRGQREQRREMLQEHLGKQCAGPHPGLLHAAHISWTDIFQKFGQQRKQDLIEAGLPLHRIQCL